MKHEAGRDFDSVKVQSGGTCKWGSIWGGFAGLFSLLFCLMPCHLLDCCLFDGSSTSQGVVFW